MLYFIIVTFFSLISYLGIGVMFFQLFSTWRAKKNYYLSEIVKNKVLLIFSYCFALQIHLWFTYLLYLVGIKIQIAFVLSLVSLVLFSKSEQVFALNYLLEKTKCILYEGASYQGIIFFFIILFLGLSAFWSDHDIYTVWVNNYGDLPFHFSLINNFSFNSNTQSDYPIFPGVRLSYYFMYDFWTACLQLYPNQWQVLSLISLLQWLFCWSIVYLTLKALGSEILVYMILFAGGTYRVFSQQFSAIYNGSSASEYLSHFFIEKSYPWTVLLSTVWIPQRIAVFGLALLMPAICLFFLTINSLFQKNNQIAENDTKNILGLELTFILLGVYFALMSISHFYFSFISLLLIGIISLILISTRRYLVFTLSRSLLKTILFSAFFIIPPAIILSSKSGIVTFIKGWMPWSIKLDMIFDPILGSVIMWISNGTSLLILFLILFFYAPRVYAYSLFLLFLLFNLVKFTIWDWDVYKLFIGLYLISIAILSTIRRPKYFDSVCVFLLCLPALMEVSIILFETKPLKIYEKSNLYKSRLLRERTEDEIIISEPVHTSVVTLSGKNIYSGYSGWLSSHNIDYKDRDSLNIQILNQKTCDKYPKSGVVPAYVYSTNNLGTNFEDPVLKGLVQIQKQCRGF